MAGHYGATVYMDKKRLKKAACKYRIVLSWIRRNFYIKFPVIGAIVPLVPLGTGKISWNYQAKKDLEFISAHKLRRAKRYAKNHWIV